MWLAWERREKCTRFRWESQKERDHLDDQSIDRRMHLRETGCGSVEWIQLAQNRDQWRALVNKAMNLWVLAPHS
jgi:hypothetical protein